MQKDEKCQCYDMARDSAEILKQEHVDSLAMLQEYQRYCYMTSTIHSMINWDSDKSILKCITDNHPNIWQIDMIDGTEYQSTLLYNDILSSLYNSFAILFNACCAQNSTDVEPLAAALPRKRSLFRSILGLCDIIRRVFTCYLPTEELKANLACGLHEDAFHILFSLADLSMTELLLIIYIDASEKVSEKDSSFNAQAFLSALVLYADISASLQERISNIYERDHIFLEIEQELSTRAPLFLAYFYCFSAKASAVLNDLKLAFLCAKKADIFLSQCSLGDSESTYTVDSNQAPSPGHIKSIIQCLQGEIDSIRERVEESELTDILLPPPLTIENVRDTLLANDSDYEVPDSYALLLGWDHEKNQLTFTPPEKDSTGSFDAALDGIDLEDVQDDSKPASTQEDIVLATEDILDSKSDTANVAEKQEQLSRQDTEERTVEDPSSSTYHSDQISAKSSQPSSIVYIDHTPTMNGLSIKGEGSMDLIEAPSIELPTLTIEKPSKVPTPTFTNSIVERVASGDMHVDHTYNTRVPTLEGPLPPRHAPVRTNPEYSKEAEEHDMAFPVDLLPDNLPPMPFDYHKTVKNDAQDILPASAHHLVEPSSSNNDAHTSEEQPQEDLQGELLQNSDEVPPIQDQHDAYNFLEGPNSVSYDPHIEAISDAMDIEQNNPFQEAPLPSTEGIVDQLDSGDNMHVDHTHNTAVLALEDPLPPRYMPVDTDLKDLREAEEYTTPLPVNLLSDTLPASTEHLLDPLPSDKDVHTSEEQPQVDLSNEAAQIQEQHDAHSFLEDRGRVPRDPYIEAPLDVMNIEQNNPLSTDNHLPSASNLSEDDDTDNMTTKDLICSHSVHDTPEHDSTEIREPEDDGDRRTILLDEIALEMRQSTQSGCFMNDSSRIDELAQDTKKELDAIVNEMNVAQSDDSLKISSNTSFHSSGNEVSISRMSPELIKPNSVVALPTQLTVEPQATAIDVNAVIAEKINPEEAMNATAPVFMANIHSTPVSHVSNLMENALSYCEEVSLQQSVNSSTVNNIVLSVGSGAGFSASTESIKKFLSDSQTSLGMTHSISLSHSYIDKARIRRKIRLLQSRAERAILITLLIIFVIAIVCTL